MPTDGRVIAVFQPHRYSRTRALYREFGDSFASADAVLITEVYGAGEMPQPGVNGKLIVDAICETRPHPEVYYIPQQDAIPGVLKRDLREGRPRAHPRRRRYLAGGRNLLDVLEGPGILTLEAPLRAILISAAVAVATTLTVLLITYLSFPVTGRQGRRRPYVPRIRGRRRQSRITPASLPSIMRLLEEKVESNPLGSGCKGERELEVRYSYRSG